MKKEMSKPNGKCLCCNRPQLTRGLCSVCYGQARMLVKQQIVTWCQLEAQGLAQMTYIGSEGEGFSVKFREKFLTAPSVSKASPAIAKTGK